MYDYIIVGAGINGKILAYLLSFSKSRILLIDKKDASKKIKLENIIITNKSYQTLKRLLKFNLSSYISEKINNIVINGKDTNLNVLILNLKKLEIKLLEEYKNNNGKLLDKTQISKYDFKNNIIYILNKKYKYKKLIAADGTMSEVRINLTGKIQKFKIVLQAKTNKVENKFIFKINKKLKTLEWVIPLRRSNLFKIINNSKKNNSLKNLNKINLKYGIKKCLKTDYFIPNNNLLFQVNNVYFIGDAAGLVNPIFNTSFGMNISYIEKFSNSLINDENINYKKIRNRINIIKFLSKCLYLPLLSKVVIKIILKIYKEDVC